MANRPVFRAWDRVPYVAKSFVEFEWFAGMSKVQKQKCVRSLHEAYHEIFPKARILEISSKSEEELGVQLSAFNLTKYVPSLGKSVSVECVYHAGKVFENGGPYLDLLEMSPKDAKRDPRLKNSGKLIGFQFEGEAFPLKPMTWFYDFIYMNALLEHKELAEALLEYDAFTDIVFNPSRSVSTQAQSAARFVSMSQLGLLDKIKERESFFA